MADKRMVNGRPVLGNPRERPAPRRDIINFADGPATIVFDRPYRIAEISE
jgi:hypothetical protein